jgi:hypothetical protein
VIELAIDPGLDDALDVVEVGDHIATVERVGANLDLCHGVVSVGMLADAVVIEETMAVTEVDALGDRVHSSWYVLREYLPAAPLPPQRASVRAGDPGLSRP